MEVVSLAFGAMTVAVWAQPGRAAGDLRPIVIETGNLQPGNVFACRIPVELRYEGSPRLRQIRVIARVIARGNELASTGLAIGPRPLILDRDEEGAAYEAVPLQFDLTAGLCDQLDGLRIVFASCVLGERPAENCLHLIRFASADTSDPLHLPVMREGWRSR
jgi:hypothetical protein